jgi:hypothetical protein
MSWTGSAGSGSWIIRWKGNINIISQPFNADRSDIADHFIKRLLFGVSKTDVLSDILS